MLSQRRASIITWLFGQQHVSRGVGSARYGGSLQCLLTEATPAAPLLPQPGLSNPIHHMLQDRILAPTLTASTSRHQDQGFPNPLSSDWVYRPDHHWEKKPFRYCKSTVFICLSASGRHNSVTQIVAITDIFLLTDLSKVSSQ